MNAQDIIKLLQLEPLEGEGGYFRQTYNKVYAQHTSTAIYYLVDQDSFSKLHRLKQDEIFHFYLGDAVELLQICPQGEATITTLGAYIDQAMFVQSIVPAFNWQGLRLKSGGKWALLGTTMSPGFKIEEFELGQREQLLKLYPHLRQDILRFT